MLSFRPLSLVLAAILIPTIAHAADAAAVTVTVKPADKSPEIPPLFLGLSYETSAMLPDKDGKYYFDANNKALVQVFQTLQIKSLRVGGNSVDDARIGIPTNKDIDSLFAFAKAAGVKVVYSVRLKNGKADDSARQCGYIADHYPDQLDAFSMGNEPSYFLKTYDAYYKAWKGQYDAILKVAPKAMFCGPSTAVSDFYGLNLAKALSADGHIAAISDHYYFFGSGRAAEKNPAASRAKFLSNSVHTDYDKAYAEIGAKLAEQNVPYRIDELNNCYFGGAKDSSDTYASTLWALDCTHWWATKHLLGMNYHTGETVGRDGGFSAPNYAAFTHATDGNGFYVRPQAYAMMAFAEGAHGQSLPTSDDAPAKLNFDSYTYKGSDGSYYVTLINKSYGDGAQPADVSIQLPADAPASGKWERLDVVQKTADVSAKTDVMIGGAPIDPQGNWAGKWQAVAGGKFTVAPASAAILHLSAK